MALRFSLDSRTVEADSPEELADLIQRFPSSRSTDARSAGGAVEASPLSDRIASALGKRVPSDEVLKRFWQKLGSSSQRHVVRVLVAHEEGVTRERLIEEADGKALAGVFGGLAKNSLPDFTWSDWVEVKEDVYRLDLHFLHRFCRVLLSLGINPFVTGDAKQDDDAYNLPPPDAQANLVQYAPEAVGRSIVPPDKSAP